MTNRAINTTAINRGLAGKRRELSWWQTGAAMSELLVVMLGLAPLALGAIQGALIFNAKVVLNNATFEAARAGAVNNGLQDPMRSALARQLVPLYGGGTDSGTLGVSYVKARTDVAMPANPLSSIGSSTRIAILSPTREAFDDFGVDVNGRREIPNEHLRHKSRDVGENSGVNLQDANLLKIRVTYGYRLFVPVINRMIASTLLLVDPGNAQYYTAETPRIPIVATATVRMQTNPVLNGNESSPGAGAGGAPADVGDGGAPADGTGDGTGTGDGAGGDDGAGSNPGGDGGAPGDGSTSPGDGGTPPGDGSSPPPGNGGTPPGNGGTPPGNGGTPPGNGGTPPGTGSGNTLACTSGTTNTTTTVASTGVGNPINVVNGNKYQREVDFKSLPGSLGLEFERHYNSQGVYQGPLGYNWTHTYDVKVADITNDRLILRQSDGRTVVFNRKKSLFVAQLATDGWATVNNKEVIWHWRNGKKLQFDANSALTRIILANGDTLSLNYDRSGRLLQIEDPQERTIAFTYYKNNRIKTMIDPTGLETRYRYDLVGNLYHVQYSDGSERFYHYEDLYDTHNLTGITDGLGIRYATYGYDSQDRAVLSAHAEDVGKVKLEYRNKRTIVTDGKGNRSTYTTDVVKGIPVVISIQGPGCSSCEKGDVQFTYNERFQMLSSSYKDGNSIYYSYDNRSRLRSVERKSPDGKRHLIERYAYWKDQLVPSVVSKPSVAPGKLHSYFVSYNETGQITQLTETGLRPIDRKQYSAIERTTKYIYEGNRLKAVDGPLPGKRDTTYYKYDENGRLSEVRAPENLVSRYSDYDNYGRPRTVVDPNGLVTRYQYNYQGQPIEIVRGTIVYRIRYDMEGRPAEIQRPDNTVVRALYDQAGRIERILDPKGNQLIWTRDRRNNVTAVEVMGEDGILHSSQKFEYNDLNQMTRSVVPTGTGSSYFYDVNGRIKAIADDGGHRIAYQYDPLGNVSRILVAIEENRTALVRVSKDHLGRTHSVIDPNGNETAIYYDDFGFKVLENRSDKGIALYRYDDAGRLTGKVNEQGAITRYYYDDASRLIGAGGSAAKPAIKYGYQGTRLSYVSGPNQAVRYQYNDNGALSREEKTILGLKFATEYNYDATTGKLHRKVLPDGKQLDYRYDQSSGRLRSVSIDGLLWSDDVVNNIGYQPFGSVNHFVHGNGLATTLGTDQAGKPVSLVTDKIQRFIYRYDKAGHITELVRNGETEHYRYDLSGKLKSAHVGDSKYAYSYDQAGNRLSQTANEVQQKYEYARNGVQLATIKSEHIERYSYSRTGNPLVIGKRQYLYSGGGRPRAVFNGGQLAATYVYNYQGQRVAKTVSRNGKPETTIYLYEGGRVVAEADKTGKITSQYIYLGAWPVAKLEGETVYSIHTDHLGTPQVVTDKKGAVVWKAAYSPFGKASISYQKITLNLRYPGQYYDAETGTHYNYYRDYDPQTGRYLTPDPIGVSGGLNTYVYANNDPLQRTDTVGLYSTEVHYYMTYFLARVAGIGVQEALTVALAAQYVDDNVDTQPIGLNMISALPAYHFTIDPGDETDTNPLTRINNPLSRSEQLQRLRRAAIQELELREYAADGSVTYMLDNDGNQLYLTRCSKAQLYGEFLHAFEDSFAHRGRNNELYGRNFPGHGLDGHSPDHTYNQIYIYEDQDPDTNEWASRGYENTTERWRFNQSRTLQMEQEVWNMLQSDFSPTEGANGVGGVTPQDGFGNPITWAMLAGDGTTAHGAWVLTGNRDSLGYPLDSQGRPRDSFGNILQPNTGQILQAMPESSIEAIQWQRTCDGTAGGSGCQSGGILQQFNREKDVTAKIQLLNDWLVDHGFEDIPAYSQTQAMQNRTAYLADLVVQDDFLGVILPSGNDAVCISGIYSIYCP